MTKFITVHAISGEIASFNISHIIYVTTISNESNDAVIFHTSSGNNIRVFYTQESYEEIMKMINE